MNILVTGGNGFIGKKLSNSIKPGDNLKKLVSKPSEKVADIVLDLTDFQQVEKALQSGVFANTEVIIHLSSVVAKTSSVDDLEILFRNAQMAKSIAFIARETQVRKLINISSMAIYPNIDGDFAEGALPDPSVNNDCIYGLSKFNAEVLINYWLRNKPTLISHLRLAMVYGEGMHNSRIIPVMEKELAEKNSITVFGEGKRLLNMIEVNKAAAIIARFVYEDHPGVFNVGDEVVSMQQLALRISNNKPELIKKQEQGNKSQFRLIYEKLTSALRI